MIFLLFLRLFFVVEVLLLWDGHGFFFHLQTFMTRECKLYVFSSSYEEDELEGTEMLLTWSKLLSDTATFCCSTCADVFSPFTSGLKKPFNWPFKLASSYSSVRVGFADSRRINQFAPRLTLAHSLTMVSIVNGSVLSVCRDAFFLPSLPPNLLLDSYHFFSPLF